jgi:hypothetical protein
MLTAVRVLRNQKVLAIAVANMARGQQADRLRLEIMDQVFSIAGDTVPYKKDREDYFASFINEYTLEEMERLSGIVEWLISSSPDKTVVRSSVDTLISAVYLDGRNYESYRVDAIHDYGHLCPEVATMRIIVSTIPRLKMLGTMFVLNAEAHLRAAAVHDITDHRCNANACLSDLDLLQFINENPEHSEEIMRYRISRNKIPESIETMLEVAQLGAVRDGWL